MKRNKFSLSHYKLLTMDMGELIPLTWFEVLPGDTIQQATSTLIRVSPLLAPVMHPVRVRVHHWYVPLRIIWDDFEDFITGGPDGTDASVPPYIGLGSPLEGSLFDYLGIPPDTYSPTINCSMLPIRAYQRIWNDHYRDQDIITEATIATTSGPDATTDYDLRKVAWEKDYFTTARPWEQKGDEVTIPLGDEAPVKGIGKGNQTYDYSSQAVYETDGTNPTYATASVFGDAAANNYWYGEQGDTGYPNIYADLSQATGIAINDLRLALAIQRYQEARAQYGSRYVEYLRYLGVRSSDGRLQNPEYLGGGRQVIQFSEVLSTNDDDTTDYAGRLRGHGIGAMRTNKYRRFFEEHGIVMTLLSVIPKSIYTQGLHKSFTRETKEDFFQKELQYIGDQEVYNKEVYMAHTNPDNVFGYQSRYDEYRSMPSGIAGEFRSTLDHWHYGRIFSSDPSLNPTFIQSVPTKRVNVSTGTNSLYVMCNHSIQARRMMSKYAKNKTF